MTLDLSMDIRSLFTPFPTLTTQRLMLRALRQTDLQDLFDYASDPEIDRYTPWIRYQSLAEAQADLNDFIADYERDGLGAWGIEHVADQRLVGIINLSLPHPRNRRTELGFTIARAYWRQGFASEAARAVIEFALGPMQLHRVEAVCLPDNLASARALTNAGMQYEGLLRCYQIWRGKPRDLQMYAATASAAIPGTLSDSI
jgi:ribosomal-protein-alanine N-acetyltransferase